MNLEDITISSTRRDVFRRTARMLLDDPNYVRNAANTIFRFTRLKTLPGKCYGPSVTYNDIHDAVKRALELVAQKPFVDCDYYYVTYKYCNIYFLAVMRSKNNWTCKVVITTATTDEEVSSILIDE